MNLKAKITSPIGKYALNIEFNFFFQVKKFQLEVKSNGPGKALRQEFFPSSDSEKKASIPNENDSSKVSDLSSSLKTASISSKTYQQTQNANNFKTMVTNTSSSSTSSSYTSSVTSIQSNENKTDNSAMLNNTSHNNKYSSLASNRDKEEEVARCEKFKQILSNNPVNLGKS